jgi:hypothetical protein
MESVRDVQRNFLTNQQTPINTKSIIVTSRAGRVQSRSATNNFSRNTPIHGANQAKDNFNTTPIKSESIRTAHKVLQEHVIAIINLPLASIRTENYSAFLLP